LESLLAKLDEGRGPAPGALPRVPVVMPVALDQTYDYALPPGIEAPPGTYVAVPFGPQSRIGIVWDGPAGEQGKPISDKRRKVHSLTLRTVRIV
jgi:primosomal protein N' (replication factor Y)